MKIKKTFLNLALISASLSAFTIINPQKAHALSINDSNLKNQIGKINYYKLTKATKIKYFGCAQSVTIPKGTVLAGEPTIFSNGTVDNPKKSLEIQFNFFTTSYHMRKNWVQPHRGGTWIQSNYSSNIKNVKLTSAPKYLFDSSMKNLSYSLGDNYTYTTAFKYNTLENSMKDNKHKLVIATTDGYIDYYKNGIASAQKFNKPTASQKIYQVTQKGNTKYYYYKNAITGIKEKKVSKTGNKRYRLTVKNLNKPTHYREKEDPFATETFNTFTVGGTKYYSYMHDDGE